MLKVNMTLIAAATTSTAASATMRHGLPAAASRMAVRRRGRAGVLVVIARFLWRKTARAAMASNQPDRSGLIRWPLRA
jgi:hypothetical protein